MRFGIRECTNIVFRAKTNMNIGTTAFKAGQPVLYIDSAKTSSLEGSGDSVYAKGGRGNTNLITWEGNKTLTFTMEDALISPLGMAILSGAGLLDNDAGHDAVHVHKTILQSVEGSSQYNYYVANVANDSYIGTALAGVTNDNELRSYFNAVQAGSKEDNNVSALITAFNANIPGGPADAINTILNFVETEDSLPASYASGTSAPVVKILADGSSLTVDVSAAMLQGETICAEAPMYVLKTEPDGSLKNSIITIAESGIDTEHNIITLDPNSDVAQNETVFVDFYAIAKQGTTKEVQIDAEHFAGYFYVEADTLFRRQIDGKDCPAIITLPNVKIQSNFTFTMSSDGDPSEKMRLAA